jgi:molecular chaperone Hsp33
MPFADEDTITALETNLGKISSLTSLFDQGMNIQDVMQLLFQGMDVEITETLPTAYHCNCSRERVKKALISLGKKEIQSIIADGKPAVLNCHFCNTDYSFSIEELKEIIAE